MKPRFHDHDPFPQVAGEAADLCERLQADLEFRAGAVILHVYGEADAYTGHRWQRILDTALTRATGRLVVDLSGTQFIGCRPILDLAERAQHGLSRGVQVVVFNPFPSVMERVVAIAGLNAWLPVYTTLAEALAVPAPSATPAEPVVPVPGAR
ncbi:anti-sigma factor antagonist [Nocardia asteroides]|uniref:anti-sigma factor antagonist n=1 Tax=Nocardia asteroides TaxID=1824 RepID=UPI001E3CE283|nr:anti-sigma factor antagonist [Nocardia asteroides]UGT57011.1 anti-sigma factor antagonist [Nocardia asteroides]